MPITSNKSDQIFQIVSRKQSTPWTNFSVVLEKNYKKEEIREGKKGSKCETINPYTEKSFRTL